MKTIALLAFLTFSVSSCLLGNGYEDNPATCQTNAECASKVCNLQTYYCEPVGGVDSGSGGTGGTGGTAPDGPGGNGGTLADGPGGTPGDGAGGLDTSISPDAAADVPTDTFVPDAPGSCSLDQECPAGKPLCLNHACATCTADTDCAGRVGAPACDTTSGRCVACVANKHCSGTTPVCDTANAKCVGCLVAATDCTADPSKSFCVSNECAGCQTAGGTACTGTKPVCAISGTALGQCVECLDSTACTKDLAKGFCVNNACTGCHNAGANACTGAKAACATTGTSAGQCVECLDKTVCTKDPAKGFCVNNACAGCDNAAANPCSGATPVCAPSTTPTVGGQCVGCIASADCTVSTKPICTSNACGPCTADSQCVTKLGANPGVCMTHQDDRCATDAETIYVANVASCLPSGATAGTSTTPLCGLQPAVTAMGTDATKHLIVLRSSADPITVTNATQVSIVGQNTASVTSTGTTPGITLSGAGNLYARDLSVIGSVASNMGISAGPGTTLRLERVKVLNNGGTSGGGGILLNGAAFDLEDVLVSGNGTGQDGGLTWSGIYVKALPSTGATKLNLVSVVNNASPGMTCAAAVPEPSTSIYASGNGVVNIANSCSITPCAPALAGTCGSSLSP